MKNVRNLLPEWVKEGLISPEQARNIDSWISEKENNSPSVLVILSIIGALLTGIGIILIVAHNWDYLPHTIKLLFALLPAVAFTALKLFAIFKKPESAAWREATAILQLLSFGASISLLSQIYQLGGTLDSFLLAWITIATPTLFYDRSSSLFPLITLLATWFVLQTGFNSYAGQHPVHYIWMIGSVIGLLWYRYRAQDFTRLFQLMSWLLPMSFAVALSTFIKNSRTEEMAFLMYIAYSAFILLAGKLFVQYRPNFQHNGFAVLGRIGILILITIMSYKFYWKMMKNELFEDKDFISDYMFYISIGLWLCGLLLYLIKKPGIQALPEWMASMCLFVLTFLAAFMNPVFGMLAVNISMLLIGVFYIQKGVKSDNLRILNYGSLWVLLFVLCRFFDFNVSFLVRGVFFILLGLIFFGVNYYMVKRKEAVKNEQ